MAKQHSLTYADAGVNIDAGNRFVDLIKPLVKATARAGSDTDIGGFGGIFDLKALNYKDPLLVACTDGVGTKLKLAIESNIHNTIGIDLVAMCVNDLVVQGAEPLFFLDYFACAELSPEQGKSIVEGIAEGCKQAGCALIGGETAEMPGMYQQGDYDLAGFSVGIVERDQLLPKKNIAEGDVIIGLPSSGVHSNGFSLVRKILAKGSDISTEEWLTPTRIYVDICLKLAKQTNVKAFAHITGGGLTENLPRVLPKGCGADIDCASLPYTDTFKYLQKAGNIESAEMLKTFNCGVGMCIVAAAEDKDAIIQLLEAENEAYAVIGSINADDASAVSYSNLDALDA